MGIDIWKLEIFVKFINFGSIVMGVGEVIVVKIRVNVGLNLGWLLE